MILHGRPGWSGTPALEQLREDLRLDRRPVKDHVLAVVRAALGVTPARLREAVEVATARLISRGEGLDVNKGAAALHHLLSEELGVLRGTLYIAIHRGRLRVEYRRPPTGSIRHEPVRHEGPSPI